MDLSEKKSESNSKRVVRKKGVWSNLFSCFNGGLSLSDEERKKMSNWGKRQIVVPVQNSGEIEIEISNTNGDSIGMKEGNQLGMKNRHKSSKDKSKTTTISTKPQQPLPTQDQTSVCHVATTSETRTEPAPLSKTLDPVHTKHLPEPGSPRTRSTTHNPSMGLCVIITALVFIILCGFTFAVIFMCVWFYIMHMLRNDDVSIKDVNNNKSRERSEKVDVNSEEYKKKVVLKGFLDRDRRTSLADRIKEAGL